MGYIFLSYSHKDKDYVHLLAEHLDHEGFNVWMDYRLDYGSEWPNEIQQRVDFCDTMILIMSPHSYKSRWVQNELHRAVRKDKPVFPLLLEGSEPWLSVESTQLFDVTDRKMPDEKLSESLAQVTPRRNPTSRFPQQELMTPGSVVETPSIMLPHHPDMNEKEGITDKNILSNEPNKDKKGSQMIPVKGTTKKAISSLIRRHNEDYRKVLDTRDKRYLKATTTDKGFAQANQAIVNLLDYLQEKKIKSTYLTDMKILNMQYISDTKIEATVDEDWEEKYIDNHVSRIVGRNIYELVFFNGTWLINSCEVLRSADNDNPAE